MEYPKVIIIKQKLQGPMIAVAHIERTVSEEMQRIGMRSHITPGMRIALTAGSRGIANIHLIIRAVVSQLKEWGAAPFIIPAMGSHGGATAGGQIEVLHGYGVTEAFCGAPIVSSMEVAHIGSTLAGVAVYTDQHAWEADGIIIIGRIKVHTDFQSPHGFESGLMKMAAIGMGKHKQALALHHHGVIGIRDMMPEVAKVVLEKANILCGIGIVENALEQTALIEAIPSELIPVREAELLKLSATYMPSLPVEDLDILMVDHIGKNYSGTGMDTNIIGRVRIHGVDDFDKPRIKYVIAGDLSEESHGNALGIGLADLTTKRLFDKIDFQKTNENVITSTFLHRAMIPIILDNDKEALTAALKANWGVKPEQARFARIHSTLHLEHLYVSESLIPEIRQRSDIEIMGAPERMSFDEQGNFASWHN
ncbi:DUF2088 domain-containing protein [Paenibacillus sp. LMG 31456]|uniref:DUF2088 domain-containing protein n=1 Tax=Paenibacillus foliorum TaxID=2654974 RepID=A0A972GVW6_9BACL|nr:lactate racemase domain-containing protein [Paenibacillus foliorum]NOU94787.1 DUF2088 domain-containing protein [Paenibacillus foliorum]